MSTGKRAQRLVVSASSQIGSRLIRRLPEKVQRLAGGRPITIDGNTLDPATQMALAGQHAIGFTTMGVVGDVAATRARATEVCRLFGGPTIDVETTDLAIEGPAGPIKVRHYRSDMNAPLLVFFHGGGYVFGDLDTHDAFCRLICRDARTHVLAVDYRLAPEHKAPAAVDDAYAAYRWARAHAAELGASPAHVAVSGDSAGGGLAATICQLARDAGEPMPLLQMLLYPYVDIDVQTRSRTLFAEGFLLTEADQVWFASQYLDGSRVSRHDPRVSPLQADDLTGLPPAIVVTAGFDPLRDQGNAYAAALQSAGTTAELLELGSMVHAFGNFLALGGAVTAACGEITSALREHLSNAQPTLAGPPVR